MHMLNNDQSLIYAAVLVISAFVLLLIGVVVAYLRLISKYLALKEGKDTQLDPQKMLVNAQQRSQKILEEAHNSARQIVANAEKFLASEQGLIAKEMEKVSQIYAKAYQEALLKIQEESIKTFRNIPQDIKLFVVKALDDFRLTLAGEVAKAQAKTLEALSQSVISAQAEIDKYKQVRLRQIDESAVKIVAEVTKKVLGRQLSLDEHEKLVLKALEEAKRQNIF